MSITQTTDPARQQAFWPLVADDMVDQAMNQLIPQADELIKKGLFSCSHHGMERHQFTNLVTTALETNSAAVVLDYVRYQIGRDSKGNTWRVGKPGFGVQLLEQLERLKSTADGLIVQAIREYGIEPPDQTNAENKLWIQLVRRFVGSLHHHFVYYKVKEGRT